MDSENWTGLTPLELLHIDQEESEEDAVEDDIVNEEVEERAFVKKHAAVDQRGSEEEKTNHSPAAKKPAKTTSSSKNDDYSFLDEINGDDKATTNLKSIKKLARNSKVSRDRYYDDYDDASDDYSEGGDDDSVEGSDGSVDYDAEEKRGSRKSKKYESIEQLLDSFQPADDNENPLRSAAAKKPAKEEKSPLVQNWNMVNHLPAAAMTYFLYTIGKSLPSL